MAQFKPYDYNQMIMLPVCLAEQILPNSLEHTIHTLIENRIAMSIFDARYKNDETGCHAYNPKVLLKVVLLGYARGLLSSRKLENACRENILFMALSCGQVPDHSTLASFVSSMEKACQGCHLRHRCLVKKNAKKRTLSVFYDKKLAECSHEMIRKIDTDIGRQVYGKRLGIIEPVFANIREQKRMDRFLLRRKSKVNIQWMLYCIVHNIEKILTRGTKNAFATAG